MENVFVIAEAGVNHNGKEELAFKLVDAAADAGADAVKFQTFIADNEISRCAAKADYQIEATGGGESQLEMCRRLQLEFGAFIKLKEYCDQRNILFLSSCFCFHSLDFIDPHVPCHKIGSGELTNLPYLRHVASKGKPILLATGMSTMAEVAVAVEAIQQCHRAAPNQQFPPLTLLHCVTNYPASYADINLRAMGSMAEAFKLPVGYSDHSIGNELAIAAVALGATVIEKHFTLDKTLEGPDHSASASPEELAQLVQAIRHVEVGMGTRIKRPAASELQMSKLARRSLIISSDTPAGTVITAEMLEYKRPATGISPSDLEKVIGMALTKDKKADDVLFWDDLK